MTSAMPIEKKLHKYYREFTQDHAALVYSSIPPVRTRPGTIPRSPIETVCLKCLDVERLHILIRLYVERTMTNPDDGLMYKVLSVEEKNQPDQGTLIVCYRGHVYPNGKVSMKASRDAYNVSTIYLWGFSPSLRGSTGFGFFV